MVNRPQFEPDGYSEKTDAGEIEILVVKPDNQSVGVESNHSQDKKNNTDKPGSNTPT